MASPGMMQSGLSRQLFEAWCTDKRNGVIVAGYCVEGTLAKVIARVSLCVCVGGGRFALPWIQVLCGGTLAKVLGISKACLQNSESTYMYSCACAWFFIWQIKISLPPSFHESLTIIDLCLITHAQHILSDPSEVVTMTGQKLPLRMSVGK